MNPAQLESAVDELKNAYNDRPTGTVSQERHTKGPVGAASLQMIETALIKRERKSVRRWATLHSSISGSFTRPAAGRTAKR